MATDLPAVLNLTERQTAFVQAYVEMGDAAKAAEAAGYGSSAVAGYRLSRHPALLAAIRYETARRLQGLAPVALTVLQDIMLDAKVAAKVRADCAIKLLDRAGHAVPSSKPTERPNDKPQSELSEAELVAMLQSLRKTQAEEAELVQTEAEIQGFAPDNAAKSNSGIDMFE